jgi:hypothetical protein
MLDKLCIGWDASPHHVLRVQTFEVAGIATLNLCPLCAFALSWDPLLRGTIEPVNDEFMEGADSIVFAYSYLDPLPKET